MQSEDPNKPRVSGFKEGQWYRFRLKSEIIMPDGEKQYLLEDCFGIRHLLSYDHYKDYGFTQGQDLNVRIDKINCSGKIFLEPEHPHYTEGEIYDFSFIRAEQRENLFEKIEYVWILLDALNHEIVLPMKQETPEPIVGEAIPCRVMRIKKGRLHISHPLATTSEGLLTEGTRVSFYVEKRETEIDGIPYYILADPSGQHHLLKKRPFEAYDIEAGREIVCKVAKWSNKGMYILEPEHPLYFEGGEFTFEITGISEKGFTVDDVFENKVEVDLTQATDIKIGEVILLKIKEMRKGRPVLILP